MSPRLKNTLSIIIMLCLGFALLRMPTQKVCFDLKNQHICLRVLRNQSDQKRGFQMVENVHPHEGLLYILTGPKIPDFWMKDVIQPLDIVFIDINGRILDNVAAYPLRKDLISPPKNAAYAIELMRGQAANLELIKGKNISEKTLLEIKSILAADN